MITSTRRRSILIADDEEKIRESLGKRLAGEGYYCQKAHNADGAIEKLRRNAVELIILDDEIAGKSERGLFSEIKESHPDTAVIISSTVPETNIIIEYMKEGAQDYIIKPFDLDEVVVTVDRAILIRQLELLIRGYQQPGQKAGRKTKEMHERFLCSIESLVFALEAKDKHFVGHSRRVTEIAVLIGQELGLPAEELEDLRWGALLHDIGKIAVKPSIHNKPAALTPEEYRHIMIHPHVGRSILEPVVNKHIIQMIAHHHDRYDGLGLDQGVVGADVPLKARILAVADTFDAVTSDRPYRQSLPVEEAIIEIKRCSGSQFDPSIINAFLRTRVAETPLVRA